MSVGSEVVGKAVYQTEVDKTGLRAGLADTDAAVAKSADNVQAKLGGGFAKFKSIGTDAAKAVGKELVSLGTGQVVGMIGEALGNLTNSIGLASDKMEAASAGQKIFGDGFAQIKAQAETAASTVALSSGKYLDLSNTLGNLLTNYNLTGTEAAGMSTQLIQVAADVSSLRNANPAEVVEAMGAAFRGETEPARRFGIMIDQDAVAQEALRLGLIKTTKEMTPAVKAQATYSLILKQTAVAQGDLADTATGLANAQRLAAAAQEESWTKLGEKLYPIAQKIMPMVAAATAVVVDIIAGIVTGIQNWIDKNEPLIHAISELVGWLGGALKSVLGGLVDTFDGLNNAMGGMPGGLAAVGAAMIPLGLLGGKVVGVFKDLTAEGTLLGRAISPLAGFLKRVWEGIVASAPVKAAATAAGAVASAAYQAGMKLVQGLGDILEGAWVSIKSVGQRAIAAAGAAAAAVYAGAMKVVGLIADALSLAWGGVKSAGGAVLRKIAEVAAAHGLAYTGAALAFQSLTDTLRALWTGAQVSHPALDAAAGAGRASGVAYAAGFVGAIILVPVLQDVAGKAKDALFNFFSARDGITEWINDAKLQNDRELAAQQQGTTIGTAIGTTAGVASGDAFASVFAGWLPEPEPDALETWLRGGTEIGEGIGIHLVQGVGTGVEGGLAEVNRDFMVWSAQLNAKAMADAEALGAGIPGQIGKGMQSEANKVYDAADALREILKNGTSPASRAKDFIQNGKDYIKLIEQGIKSENDGALQTAQQLAIGAIQTIAAAADGTPSSKGLKQIGAYFDELLASGLSGKAALAALDAAGVDSSSSALDGIKKQYPQFFTTGQTAAAKLKAGIEGRDWWTDGNGIAHEWIMGFAARMQRYSWANLINSTVGPKFGGNSPPPEGPLHYIDRMGFNTGSAWTSGFGLGLLRDAETVAGRLRARLGGLGASIGGWARNAAPASVEALLGTPGLVRAGALAPMREPPLHEPRSVAVHLHADILVADDAGLRRLGRELRRVDQHWSRSILPATG